MSIQDAKGRKVEVFWRAEAWPTAEIECNTSRGQSAPAWRVFSTVSILSPSTASAVTGTLNPTKALWIMYYPLKEGNQMFLRLTTYFMLLLLLACCYFQHYTHTALQKIARISNRISNTALGQRISSPQWALSTQQRWGSGRELEQENPENDINSWCCFWITDFVTGQFSCSQCQLKNLKAIHQLNLPHKWCRFHTHL